MAVFVITCSADSPGVVDASGLSGTDGGGKGTTGAVFGFLQESFFTCNLTAIRCFGGLCLVSFVVTWGVGTTYIGYKGLQKHRNACSVVIEITLAQAVLLVSGGSGLLWFAIVGIVVSVVSIVLMLLSVSGKMEVAYEGY